MKTLKTWYGTKIIFVSFVLFFEYAFIHFALAIWYEVPLIGWETLSQTEIWSGLIFTMCIIFIIIPFMYHLHLKFDNKYIAEIDIPLPKFEVHDFNSFIVVSYHEYKYNWILKKIVGEYDLEKNNCIPFKNYYHRNGEFNYAVPSIRYIK